MDQCDPTLCAAASAVLQSAVKRGVTEPRLASKSSSCTGPPEIAARQAQSRMNLLITIHPLTSESEGRGRIGLDTCLGEMAQAARRGGGRGQSERAEQRRISDTRMSQSRSTFLCFPNVFSSVLESVFASCFVSRVLSSIVILPGMSLATPIICMLDSW